MHLFVCLTILQVKIANRIIEEEGLTNVKKVFLTMYDELNEVTKNFTKDFHKIYYRINLMNKDYLEDLKGDHYESIYFASLDNDFIMNMVGELNIEEVRTFDDGFGGIYPYGHYADKNNLQVSLIKNVSKIHYTIYPLDYFHVMAGKRYYLENFWNFPKSTVKNGKSINVLIGQNLIERNLEFNNSIINKYKEILNIDLYIPHPRSVEPSEVKEMAEDTIVDLMSKYENVNVYHFSSSISIHFKGIEGVNCIGIKTPLLQKEQGVLGRFYKCPVKFIEFQYDWETKANE